ncbi:MAG TPA: hypothetical protein VKV69_12440 [Actinomycetota bacterium]|nr:hypothetical protein [Actinomycetota bacterium]
MATHRAGRRAHRVVMVASIAIIGVGIFALAATSEEASKPGPVPQHEGGVIAPPAEAAASVDPAPASAPLPEGVTCPPDWSYFDNPVMHYGLCIPAGWGFSDFRGPDPLDRIPSAMLENLHLLGNAFPWRPGTMPFDAVRRGATDIELDVLPADATSSDECQPSTKRLLGILSVLSCEQLYGTDGLPAATGLLRALKVIVPLRTGPADEPGARLLLIARTRTAASLAEVTTLWQIVQYVHAY